MYHTIYEQIVDESVTYKLINQIDAPILFWHNIHPPRMWNGTKLEVKNIDIEC